MAGEEEVRAGFSEQRLRRGLEPRGADLPELFIWAHMTRGVGWGDFSFLIACLLAYKRASKPASKQASKQAHRQTSKQANKQADKQANKPEQ